jgi:hypothetical protein
MKRKKIIILIVLILISLFFLTFANKRESFDDNFITFNSWWGDDDKSKKIFSELFDIPEIRQKYKSVHMYGTFGDVPIKIEDGILYSQFSGESNYGDPSKFHVNFIPIPINGDLHKNVVDFPYGAYYLFAENKNVSKFIKPRHIMMKENFCLFSVSNGSCKERNDFFSTLSKYKQVDSCGEHMNNMGSDCPGQWGSEEYCRFLSKYKFMLCFENISKDRYFTEKLLNAYMCNTIPIYWGCSNIEDYNINMKAIFYLKPNFNGEDVEQLINDIKEHDQNDELYLKKYNEPLFKNGIIPDSFDKEKLKEKIKAVIT